jgi:predicted membrane protein
MRAVTLQVGAAALQVKGLGNANAARVDLNLGIGNADLDFGGEWRGDVQMTVNSALGKVTLRVPADVGVSIESSSFLHSTGGSDMVKREGRTVSSNWDTARHKLHVQSSGAFGRLVVERIVR